MTHSDLAALAEAWVDAACAQLRGVTSREDMRATRAAFHAALAANAAEIERLRGALDECARPINGFVGKNIGECYTALLNEFVRRAEIARRAQAAEGGSDAK
jgi:Lhr-like helicase